MPNNLAARNTAMRALYESGLSYAAIGVQYRVSPDTVRRALHGLPGFKARPQGTAAANEKRRKAGERRSWRDPSTRPGDPISADEWARLRAAALDTRGQS